MCAAATPSSPTTFAHALFAELPSRYDRLAAVLSLGQDGRWRREMVGRVADRAVQIHGGSGYIRDFAVERLYRDVRLFRLYEGTTQIQQIVIARNLIRSVS